MDFRLLGPLEAVRDGRPVRIGGGKQRAMLALFLLHANEVVSRDRLIEELWSDRAAGTAGHSLDVQISRLRKLLGPEESLETTGGGYVLRVDHSQIDARQFESLLEKGRSANARGDATEALTALEAGLALWRGPPLADVAYESFARIDVDRLEELHLLATEERIEAELALGRHRALVPELESLTAKHPLRERLRGQLMLALYRSGRQAEALRVYAETRRALVDELGIEPGPALRELEQGILRHDPALEYRPPTRQVKRRRGALASSAALVFAGGAAAAVVLLTQGGTQAARGVVEPNSQVLLSPADGRVLSQTTLADTVKTRFGFGSLWSISADGELTRTDPSTGKAVAPPLGLGISPSGLATGAGSVWVTDANSPTLLRIDPSLNPPVPADKIQLPKAGTDQTSDVLVADGSVWVGHGGYNPGAWVERLDPKTGKMQHRFPILGGEATALASGEGALWVASAPSGELRKIDPRLNKIVKKVALKRGICCVAVGGGYVWAAVNPDATIWKLASDGTILSTTNVSAPITGLSYANGALWVADGNGGRVIRIDPTTDARRPIVLGHKISAVDASKKGIAVAVLENAQDATAGLTGRVVRVAVRAPTLFWSGAPTDPALTAPWDAPQLAFHYATCAKLYNYPDVSGPAGRQLVPEVAAGWPKITDGGRTYTFTIRSGYRFSPPSNEPVTAESFRHEIERVTSPKLFPGSDLGPEVVVGTNAYHSGKAAHISGISTHGDTLEMHLDKPDPTLLRTLATNQYCAVPVSTPVVSTGVKAPIPSAGPYYLATLTDSVAVLKRNPNYHGPRPQHLDAIVYELSVPPQNAVGRIATGRLDYMAETDPALAPDTAGAKSAGPRYHLGPDATAQVQWLGLNTARPLFANIHHRLAVEYALDRRALAALDAAIPATRVLSPRLTGFDPRPLYPLTADVARARALLGGHRYHAVFATFDPASGSHAAAFAQAVRDQLAAAGITASVLPITNNDYATGNVVRKVERSDLVWGGSNVNDGDPVEYLQQPGVVLPRADAARLARIATLSSPRRDAKAAALAAAIDRQALFAVYEDSALPELRSPRLGCVVHQPEFAGIDLAALCLRRSS